MTVAYPVFIAQHHEVYLVYIPDMEIYTEGISITDAIETARDAIGLKGIDIEDSGENLPKASDYEKATKLAKKNNDIFDYTTGLLTIVDVNLTVYRNRIRNKAVKKNCTIPYWLSVEAEQAGINFSKVLQEALISKLGISITK